MTSKISDIQGVMTGFDYFGARYYSSDLSVWLSVDPLASKYPSLSPYAYVANNPIMLVDPDGKRIWITEKNGENKKLLYKNGELYQRKGLFRKEKYTGNDEFAIQTKDNLNSIKSGDSKGNKMVNTLENSKKNHKIKHGDENKLILTTSELKRARKGSKIASHTQVTGEDGWIDNGDNYIKSTSESSLAHELEHMYSLDQGIFQIGTPHRVKDIVTGGPAGLEQYEVPAVQYENLVRHRLGLPLRRAYHNTSNKDATVPNPEKLIIKASNFIQP